MFKHNDLKKEPSKVIKGWEMGPLLEKADAFGEPLPTFNIKGSEQVNTRIGGIATIILFTIVLAFGAIKLEHLLEHKNPNLSAYT